MSDYLTAYRARLERNQADLIQLIHDVQQLDNTVEAYIHKDKDRMIKNVVFFKDEKFTSIWFLEVPYGWSGCGFTDTRRHNGKENCSMPFTAEDVLNNLAPIITERKSQIEIFKSKEQYLKWYSYLTKYNKDDKETQK